MDPIAGCNLYLLKVELCVFTYILPDGRLQQREAETWKPATQVE